ncbi:MAG: hypothetical protein JRJ09_09930 [Deltaproteobacteria bacterium]|nr:hypothetical protein [Deltaproteobacteria bacterium]
MTKEDAGHYAKKHADHMQKNPAIEAALRQQASDLELPCAVAFKVAGDLDVAPGDVGVTADLLEMRLIKCQLGLFGYRPEKQVVKPAEQVSEELEKAIKGALDRGRLPCASAWKIARDLSIRKMEVSSACEALGIKVCSCQLGAF